MKTRNLLIYLLTSVILLLGSSGCNALFGPQSTPTATITDTPDVSNTPNFTDTPIPSDTPPPTPTSTETVMPSPTNTPFPTWTWTPVVPTGTADYKDAILVFYINLEEKGPYGCGEDLWFLNTGVRRSETDLPGDIRFALHTMLTYHQPKIGILYHAGYASNMAVGDVFVDPEGVATVGLTGIYVPTGEPCDATRFRDQLKRTITQFPQVFKAIVFLNGAKIEDAFSRK